MNVKIFLVLLFAIFTSAYSYDSILLHPLGTAALFGLGAYLDRRGGPYSTHLFVAVNVLNLLGEANDRQRNGERIKDHLMFYPGQLSQIIVCPLALFLKNKNNPATSNSVLYTIVAFTAARRVVARFFLD